MFANFDDLRRACRDLPTGTAAAEQTALERQEQLTKPSGSLGRLEELAVWIARWQGDPLPSLNDPVICVFAGNHGVARQGVSAFPASVTTQMVENFADGGAAINQLAQFAGARLKVVPLSIDSPTEDFTQRPAMDEGGFLQAVRTGWEALPSTCDLLAVGEMGIGNTTAAAALCAALLDGDAADWVGRGTGISNPIFRHKQRVVALAVERHRAASADPLASAAALGGRELAAMLGAVLAARHRCIPVLLDGFVATAAVLPLAMIDRSALLHCKAAHQSAEAAHCRLLQALSLEPLLNLNMRLGEATGAALAIALVRAALAVHVGMATFASASVENPVLQTTSPPDA